MATHRRPTSTTDQAIVGRLHTIATRTWEVPTGQARADRIAELAKTARGRTDLLIQTAGVLLGARPPDPHDPRHQQSTYGAEMLLEVAGVDESDPRVQEWVPVGAERWTRWRRPEPPRGIA